MKAAISATAATRPRTKRRSVRCWGVMRAGKTERENSAGLAKELVGAGLAGGHKDADARLRAEAGKAADEAKDRAVARGAVRRHVERH